MIRNWLKIFLYQIKKNKLFTMLNTLGLSLGIAGLIFAILYWNDEQSYNAWNPEKEKVHQVLSQISPDVVWPYTPSPLEAYLKSDFPELENYCYLEAWYNDEVINYQSKKQIVKTLTTQNSFFEFFPFEFIYGSSKDALKSEQDIVISLETSKKIFDDINPVGKSISINKKTYLIKGVFQIPGNSSIAPELILNRTDNDLKENADQWGNFNFSLLIKVKNSQDLPVIHERINKIMFENRELKWAKEKGLTLEEAKKDFGQKGVKFYSEPLVSARLESDIDGYPEGKGNLQFMLIMVGLSVLILLLSIVNYINLATANAIQRAKEVGIRKILGASRGNIIKQFIFETVLITIFSVFLSLMMVELSLPFYNEFLGKKLVIYGGQFYLQLVFVFVIVVLFAGILPAVYVSNFETLKVLKGNFGRSKSGVLLRNGMLVFQFAIATFFLVGMSVVNEQVDFLAHRDIGFNGSQVMRVQLINDEEYEDKKGAKLIFDKYQRIQNEVSKIKGVQQVTTGAFEFGTGANSSSSFDYKGKGVQGQNMAIDFGMLEMMKINLKEGRYLTEQIASDTINSMLINEKAAKLMEEPNPIGKEVVWNNKKLTIVGVVKDFNLYSPQSEVPPMSFFHFKTIDWMAYNMNNVYMKLEAEQMQNAIREIEKFWLKNVESDYPFSYEFVDKAYARTYKQYVNQRNLFSLLNVIVIMIAMFGLFSLASYSIQRRMKEIAIRKTLGAETSILLKELSKQYVVFCLIGFVIAVFPVYFLLEKWLENFAYRIDISFMPFLIGFVVLLILTLLVVLSKAYQATKVDVLKYLKYE